MNATIWICRACMVVLLVVVAHEVLAHHEPTHREVYLNEPTEMVAQVGVCLEKEAADAAFEARKHSDEAFYATFELFMGMGGCGLVNAYVTVLHVHDVYMDGDLPISFVMVTMSNGEEVSGPVHAVLIGIAVAPERTAKEKLEQQPACFNCAAS